MPSHLKVNLALCVSMRTGRCVNVAILCFVSSIRCCWCGLLDQEGQAECIIVWALVGRGGGGKIV